jgi:hypothetical protein
LGVLGTEIEDGDDLVVTHLHLIPERGIVCKKGRWRWQEGRFWVGAGAVRIFSQVFR